MKWLPDPGFLNRLWDDLHVPLALLLPWFLLLWCFERPYPMIWAIMLALSCGIAGQRIAKRIKLALLDMYLRELEAWIAADKAEEEDR